MPSLQGMIMSVEEFHDCVLEQREKLGVASQTTPVHLHEVYQVLEQLSSKYKDMPFDG